MDRDHRSNHSPQASVLKKRYSFDVTLLEADNTLFLAQDRTGQDRHTGTTTIGGSNSAPIFGNSYPFVTEVPPRNGDLMVTTTTSSSSPHYQQYSLLQRDNMTDYDNNNDLTEQWIDHQQQPAAMAEDFTAHDDFVLFRHARSPHTHPADHPSPSNFRMSPSSSLILDNLFPELSTPF